MGWPVRPARGGEICWWWRSTSLHTGHCPLWKAPHHQAPQVDITGPLSLSREYPLATVTPHFYSLIDSLLACKLTEFKLDHFASTIYYPTCPSLCSALVKTPCNSPHWRTIYLTKTHRNILVTPATTHIILNTNLFSKILHFCPIKILKQSLTEQSHNFKFL